MPELPEVETTRRELERVIVGRRVVTAYVGKPKMIVEPGSLRLTDIVGARFQAIGRRAKYFIFSFDRPATLLVHLKLSGQLVVRRGDQTLAAGGHPVPRFDTPLPHRATHGRFDLDDGLTLWMTDIRQFGRFIILDRSDVDGYFADRRLGVEPLVSEFTVDALAQALAPHRMLPIKAALLDQTNVAGLGNIYVDEALFASRLHPLRAAASLTPTELATLHTEIRSVLSYAIQNGVAELPAGKVDPDSNFPRAHGRFSLPCLFCGTTMARIQVAGRSTDYCPTCQGQSSTGKNPHERVG
ncbi:MAG: bifunctional DNA-formamidopyrimidine glycosylase/DNA-(apurinic or apyrimidinic site) lyase [Chloroflexi bacterium]|nr:bifunctional DNA-formamidopyrimidine glycosylase/DNA-(apurinic or apyrimidinic site) lyase [Chloroflexota bacterium]